MTTQNSSAAVSTNQLDWADPDDAHWNRSDWLLIIGVMLLALVARLVPGPRTIDDAFITFRYARNLVEGLGFVYNAGEQVLGTTTPFFTLLMAGFAKVLNGQDFPWYALTASAIADVISTGLLYWLARRFLTNRWAGALLGGLWAIAPMSVTFAVGGMETSFVVLFTLATTYAFLTDRLVLMGVCAGLAALTRIDTGLWIAPLFLYQLAERWLATRGRPILARLPLRTWVAAALIMGPWLIFSTFYFGSPVPNSLAAKSLVYMMPPDAGLSRFIQIYSTPFFEFEAFGSLGAILGFVVYFPLSAFGILFSIRRWPRLLPMLLFPWIHMAAFSLANPLIFRWYPTPPMPFLMLSILAGIWSLVRRWPPLARITLLILTLAWGSMSGNAWTLHPDHGLDRPAPTMAWYQQELYYRQIAETLRDQYGVNENTRLAAGDIGVLGYVTRAVILDTVGLVNVRARAYYPYSPDLIVEGQNYAIPPRMILDAQPDYLVVMEAAVRLGLERDADFKAQYGDPIIVIPTEFYGTDVRAYKRQK